MALVRELAEGRAKQFSLDEVARKSVSNLTEEPLVMDTCLERGKSNFFECVATGRFPMHQGWLYTYTHMGSSV